MKVVSNNNIDKKKWISIVEKSRFSSPFQTPEFYDLYNSIEEFSADVFAIEENGVYKSLVVVTIQKEKGIKGFFSKRGIIYGGPVLASFDEKVLKLLLTEIEKYYKRHIIYLEIRNSFNYSKFSNVFNKVGWEYEQRLNVQLNVENIDFDDILSKMKYNRRREIKLSLKNRAITRVAKSVQEVELLFKMLDELYKERVKLPLPSFSYFSNLYKSDIGKVFVVVHDNIIIGGSFCLYDKNAIYTSYYVGIRNYHKKIFPTHLAIVGVIELAIENDLKIVDFMGAGKPNEDYGVRDFKLQFGGELVEYGRFKKIFNPLLYKIGSFGIKMLTKIK